MIESFKPLLTKVCLGEALARDEAETAFAAIMSGELTPVQIAAYLIALKVRGETIDEIIGAVSVMRAKMIPVDLSPDLTAKAVDIVGTGGDGKGSYNVSTAAALVVAACGVPVAKHGNRAVSSISGAADVLKALDVNLELSPEQIATCIEEVGIGFMFAPMHHTAMKHVGPVRAELGQRTIFNLVGPLSNPARATRQMIGVYDERWLVPMAETLSALGSETAWFVHGADGMDEITTTGVTRVAKLEEGSVTTSAIDPRDHGFDLVDERELVGGDADHNARALREVLAGQNGAYTDIVLLNAAATLCVAGKTATLDKGIAEAREAISSGAAEATLDKLVQVSNAGS